ncbi:hypothetical protein QLX08_009238 [Tetragonisca angustula]|uniref:Secreted protein n=1 Tax=Tetragonisca angustula TaxID=166442 RepID=A0AAW0ZGQ8_9HYME
MRRRSRKFASLLFIDAVDRSTNSSFVCVPDRGIRYASDRLFARLSSSTTRGATSVHGKMQCHRPEKVIHHRNEFEENIDKVRPLRRRFGNFCFVDRRSKRVAGNVRTNHVHLE